MKVTGLFRQFLGWVLLILLVAAASPAQAQVTWATNSFTLTETWDNYLTDPLVSGTDSDNLTIVNGGPNKKRRTGLEVTGTVDVFLLGPPLTMVKLSESVPKQRVGKIVVPGLA